MSRINMNDNWGILSAVDESTDIEMISDEDSLEFGPFEKNSIIRNKYRKSFLSLPTVAGSDINSTQSSEIALQRNNSYIVPNYMFATPVSRNSYFEDGIITVLSRNFLYHNDIRDMIISNSTQLIVDCRWVYEFEAGSIRGAINLYSYKMLENYLNEMMIPQDKLIIFYCEFSQRRSRKMLNYLFKQGVYTNLHLLLGGFKNFVDMQDQFIRGYYRQESDIDFEDQKEYYSQDGQYLMEISTPYYIQQKQFL